MERQQAVAETPIWELVIEDMKKRNTTGISRYGVPLLPFNGRDALQDAYEEALDLAAYLKQAMVERSSNPSPRPVVESQALAAIAPMDRHTGHTGLGPGRPHTQSAPGAETDE